MQYQITNEIIFGCAFNSDLYHKNYIYGHLAFKFINTVCKSTVHYIADFYSHVVVNSHTSS